MRLGWQCVANGGWLSTTYKIRAQLRPEYHETALIKALRLRNTHLWRFQPRFCANTLFPQPEHYTVGDFIRGIRLHVDTLKHARDVRKSIDKALADFQDQLELANGFGREEVHRFAHRTA